MLIPWYSMPWANTKTLLRWTWLNLYPPGRSRLPNILVDHQCGQTIYFQPTLLENRFPSSQEWALDHTFSRKNLPTIPSTSHHLTQYSLAGLHLLNKLVKIILLDKAVVSWWLASWCCPFYTRPQVTFTLLGFWFGFSQNQLWQGFPFRVSILKRK